MQNIVRQDIVVIYDELLVLIIEATSSIRHFDSFVSKEDSRVTGYLYKSEEWLFEVLNNYSAGQLGTEITAADLLAYRDNAAIWD